MTDLLDELTPAERRLLDRATELLEAREAAERLLKRQATPAGITAALLRLHAAREERR